MDGLQKENSRGYKPRYFAPWEVVNLNPELIVVLDKIRHDCGFPFMINSGYRKGDTKAHGDGDAVDIHLYEWSTPIWNRQEIKDQSERNRYWKERHLKVPLSKGQQRQLIHDIARGHGINRIGLYNLHVHLDISTRLPQYVTWPGVSK